LYVATAGSTDGTCTQSIPCKTIQQAIDAASGARHWIEIAAGTYPEALTISGKAIELIGAGQDMTDVAPATGNEAVITISNAPSAGIHNMKVRGAFGSNAYGVYCMAGVVPLTVTDATIADDASDGVKLCETTLVRSTISGCMGDGISGGLATDVEESTIAGNMGEAVKLQGGKLTLVRSKIDSNMGGGIDLTLSAFDIENSIITRNGGPTTPVGGVSVSDPPSGGPNAIRFSTISANQAQLAGVGVSCAVPGTITFDDDIIWNNIVVSGEAQVAGNGCAYTYSLIGPQANGQNLNMDPQFVDPQGDDFHIRVVSPAVDVGDATAAPTADYDGDTRPQGAGFDIGADEVKQ
jgi:hypothetical protein